MALHLRLWIQDGFRGRSRQHKQAGPGDYDEEYAPDYLQEPSGYEDDAGYEQDETASKTSEYDDAEAVIRC